MSFIKELKRRNVFRVGIAYTVIAWLLLQVADVVLNNIDAPAWVFRAILLVLALGFPVAALFAWVFEMTSEGLMREKEVDRSESITRNTGRKLDFTIIGLMGVALVYFAWDKFSGGAVEDTTLPSASPATVQLPDAVSNEVAGTPAKLQVTAIPASRSIAVLPFADMSPEGDQEYLSDGIAEELLNLLAQIPDLQVAARTSSFSFKGKDVKIVDVARELNVAHVLEGSVRKAGNRVRITAQLIKANDGFHLWSETFDRTLDDVFAIQDEISAAVVAVLKVHLLGEAPKSVEVNPEAYSLYLQGRYFHERRSQADWENSVEAFERALEIEPTYARALAGLSVVLGAQSGQSYRDLHAGYILAREAAQTSLELDPNLAEAHAALGLIHTNYDWDWEGAEASFTRALELAPGDARILGQTGRLQRYLGKLVVSIEMNRQAVKRDPLALSAQHQRGLALIWNKQLDEAMAIYQHILTINPEFASANLSLSRILLLQGKLDEALAVAEQEPEPFWREFGILISQYALGRTDEADAKLGEFIEQNRADAAYQIAQIYGFRGDTDRVFEWLELAFDQRDGGLPEMLYDPFLTKFSSDPRWVQILKKVGLHEAWLKTRA
jgi:adenylate cyclase